MNTDPTRTKTLVFLSQKYVRILIVLTYPFPLSLVPFSVITFYLCFLPFFHFKKWCIDIWRYYLVISGFSAFCERFCFLKAFWFLQKEEEGACMKRRRKRWRPIWGLLIFCFLGHLKIFSMKICTKTRLFFSHWLVFSLNLFSFHSFCSFLV